MKFTKSITFLTLFVIIPFTTTLPLYAQLLPEIGNIYMLLDDCREIVIENNYAYVANWYGGVRSFDITDPANPVQIGCWFPENRIISLDVQDGYIYAVDVIEGLFVLDATNPNDLMYISQLDNISHLNDIVVEGDFAYIAAGEEGMYILDITTPTPIIVANVTDAGEPNSIHVEGINAFLGYHGISAMGVVNISDPFNPVYFGGCDLNRPAGDMIIQGNLSYSIDQNHFEVNNITNPLDPVQLAILEHPPESTNKLDIDLENNIAVTADMFYGTTLIDIERPNQPQVISRIDSDFEIFCCVAVKPGYAFFGGLGFRYLPYIESAFTVVDYNDPIQPEVVATIRHGGRLYDVDLHENYAFLADWTMGIRSVDISDPENMEEVDTLRLEGVANKIVTNGEVAWVSMRLPFGGNHLAVIDISDPSDMELLGTAAMSDVNEFQYYNGYLLAALDDMYFTVEDASNPIQLDRMDWFDTPSEVSSFDVGEDIIYLLDKTAGVYILDVSDPENLEELSTFPMNGPNSKLRVLNGMVYTINVDGNLRILNATDPVNPQLAGTFQLDIIEPTAMQVQGNYLWISGERDNLYILDVTDPANVQLVTERNLYYADAMVVRDQYTYVADRYIFRVFDHSGIVEIPEPPLTLEIPLEGNRFTMVSTPLIPQELNAADVFGDLASLAIAYQNDGHVYIPDGFNTINEISIEEGYLLFCQEDEIWSITGQPIDPATEYSLLENRWNWLGYPWLDPAPVEVVLDHISPQVESIMNDEGGVWLPNYGLGPINTLGDMHPGEGFYAYVNESVTFQYLPNAGFQRNTAFSHLPVVEGAPPSTGKPYPVLVKIEENFESISPAYIEVFDGDLLVGRSAVNRDKVVHPVVCWQGFPEYGLAGFAVGNEIVVKVLDAGGKIIGGLITNENLGSIANDDQLDSNGSNPILSSNPQQKVSSVFSVSSVVKSGSHFGEGPYAQITVSASTTSEASLPDGFVLGTVYPNPFNSTLTVPFTLPEQSEVRFQLYNTLGQLQFERVALYQSGQQRFTIDAGEELVSGVYFLQVQVGGVNEVQKVILLR
ncbi:T9SS type A sorting domain-containing protein [bacterium]|nr:T9SS type A sorting domain-containing protein [bacterium]